MMDNVCLLKFSVFVVEVVLGEQNRPKEVNDIGQETISSRVVIIKKEKSYREKADFHSAICTAEMNNHITLVQLYRSPCWSVDWLVGRSVGP